MRARTIFLLLLSGILLSPLTGYLILSSNTRPGSSYSWSLTTGWKYSSSAYNSTIGWTSDLFVQALNFASTHMTLQEAELGSSTNPSQSFGFGILNGNANITSIEQTSVNFALNFGSNGTDYLFYYYNVTGATSPQEINVGNGYFDSLSSQWLTGGPGYSAFLSNKAPLIWNSGQYLELKVANVLSQDVVSFILGGSSNSGGNSGTGGGGGARISQSTRVSNQSTPSLQAPPGITQNGGQQFYTSLFLSLVISVIFLSVIIGAVSRRKRGTWKRNEKERKVPSSSSGENHKVRDSSTKSAERKMPEPKRKKRRWR